MKKDPTYIDMVQVLDYAFKFFHTSLNVNDLRVSQNADRSIGLTTIVLPGNDDNFKKVLSCKFLSKSQVGKDKRHLRHGYDKTSFFPIGMNLPELPADNPT